MFTVSVISADRALFEVCRNVLDQLGPERCELHISNGRTPDRSDIYIWDTESIPKLPVAMAASDNSTKLVIVRKALLPSVRAKLPHENFVFLHSPVSKLTLRVFLDSAVAKLELARAQQEDAVPQADPARDLILQKLLETNLKLQEYDTERTSFLTRAVHDIRAPLMAIQGYCGLLLAGQFGSVSDDQLQILERMQRSLVRLGRLAEAMMELGMGGKAAASAKLENACLESCVTQAVHEIRPFAQQKQIDLSVELTAPLVPLLFDSGQLEQVLVNLLDNGCKFTPKRGSIRILGYSVFPDEGVSEVPFAGYRLDISDSGPGIGADRIEQVFDEYTSYGGSGDRSGAGLGLAICRMIVGAHNGRIWAMSKGGGTTFSVLLPYPRAYVERPETFLAMRAAV